MANEFNISFNIAGSSDITGVVITPAGAVRQAAVTLSDDVRSKTYLGDSDGSWVAGDKIEYYYNTDLIGSEIYRPDVTIINSSDVITALKNATGFTEGGTWTFDKLMKIITAFAAGKWQFKSGSTTIYQLLDVEDNSTVVMEFTFSNTTPQKVRDVKI